MFFRSLLLLIFIFNFCNIAVAEINKVQQQKEFKPAFFNITSLLDNRIEINSGIDATDSSYFGYSGFTVSILTERDKPGWRLKWNSGAGKYQYKGTYNIGGKSIPVNYQGQVTSFDLMLGHYFRQDDWILKAYLGMNYSHHEISPFDQGNIVQGQKVGAKALIEIWKNIGDRSWISLDLAYATAFGDYNTIGRIGYRVLPELALGIEGSVSGNDNYSASRVGAIMRWKTGYGDLTLNGGMGGDINSYEDWAPYAGFSIFQRF